MCRVFVRRKRRLPPICSKIYKKITLMILYANKKIQQILLFSVDQNFVFSLTIEYLLFAKSANLFSFQIE